MRKRRHFRFIQSDLIVFTVGVAVLWRIEVGSIVVRQGRRGGVRFGEFRYGAVS